MELNLNFGENGFVNNLGETLVCYESTDRFAFLCPYTESEDGSLILELGKTYVYSLEMFTDIEGGCPAEAIETMEVCQVDNT